MRIVSVHIDSELLEMLDMIASKKGMNRSEIIRYAIREMLKQEGQS